MIHALPTKAKKLLKNYRRKYLSTANLKWKERITQKRQILIEAACHPETPHDTLMSIAQSSSFYYFLLLRNPNIPLRTVRYMMGSTFDTMADYLCGKDVYTKEEITEQFAELWTLTENIAFGVLAFDDLQLVPDIERTLKYQEMMIRYFSLTCKERKRFFRHWIDPLIPRYEVGMGPRVKKWFHEYLADLTTKRTVQIRDYFVPTTFDNSLGELLCSAIDFMGSEKKGRHVEAFIYILRYAERTYSPEGTHINHGLAMEERLLTELRVFQERRSEEKKKERVERRKEKKERGLLKKIIVDPDCRKKRSSPKKQF